MRARLWLLTFLTMSGVACTPKAGPGPVREGEVWETNGLVLERRGDHLLVIEADDGTSVLLDVRDNAKVRVQARELPSIKALFEGDRVRATWSGEHARGQARDIEVTVPQISAQRMDQARMATREGPTPTWTDTMRSPGGTIGSPWYVGTWNYQQPGQRKGPPDLNAVTGHLVPSDARPGF